VSQPVEIGLNAVIVAVTEEVPRVLTVPWPEAGGEESLPFGPLDAERDRTLELALRHWVREQTDLELGYVEQLYTFGDQHREPEEREGGPRVVSVGYLALTREGLPIAGSRSRWSDCYRFLPWEDRRQGRLGLLDGAIAPAMAAWVEASGDPSVARARRERVDIAFGLGGVAWDGERVLERYELAYEAGLVEEARRDSQPGGSSPKADDGRCPLGDPMALDHRRMLATALGRLRGKIKYRPVVFELLPPTFTLLSLQRVVEALSGVPLHKQNFRRLVEKGGLVEGTGQLDPETGGRPAELFRFRREVLRERPAPGVGLPATRR
jgi:hypothetical protein